MPVIRVADFKGRIPKLHPRLLPVNFAQIARNTRLEGGTIGPMTAPATVFTFPGPTAPLGFIKFGGTFVGFDQPNVNATVGPVAQDRLYYTGDGFPKMRVAGVDYVLGVNPPTEAPVITTTKVSVTGTPTATAVTITAPPSGAVAAEFSYRYAAVVDGVETVASEQSARVSRIAGQHVTLSGLGLPAGADLVRVYRIDHSAPSGASGRFGLVMERPASAVVAGAITDDFTAQPDGSRTPTYDNDAFRNSETVTYVYTYVTGFGEESAPSPASEPIQIFPGEAISVAVNGHTQANRNIQFIRIYRSRTSLSGVTDFYFLKELNSVTQTYADTLNQLLAETLPSADFDLPEPTMLGLISMPNGMMAAHAGRELLFCEPFQPHAWPNKYRLTTDTDIVGLGAFGSFLAVLTKGCPYIVQGSEPSLMIMEQFERSLPCVSRFSIADMGFSIAYASHEGLVVVSQGGADVVTRQLFSETQWRAMRPESFRASQIGGRYVFSYQPEVNGARFFGIIDLSGEQPYFMEADVTPRVMHYAAEDGALYYMDPTGLEVKQYDPKTPASTVRVKQTWRGKRTVLQGYDNFGAILVECDPVQGTKANPADPDCTIRVYASGNLIHTSTKINEAERLPSGFLSDTWEIEVEGYAPVTAISLANDIYELAGG